MGARARAGWVFALAAAMGLGGQTLLFVERQCWRLESALRDDFRVLLLLSPLEEAKLQVLEEKLRAQPEVAELRFVSSDDAMAALRRDDPELADSIALVGDNPLPSAFELRPTPETLARLPAWLGGVRALAEWSDLRYKPAELQAILRLRFYAHLLRATLSALLCLAAALALTALHTGLKVLPVSGWGLAGWAGAGGIAGATLAAALAWPLRREALLWDWPSLPAQAALVASCAALGWALSLWRAES